MDWCAIASSRVMASSQQRSRVRAKTVLRTMHVHGDGHKFTSGAPTVLQLHDYPSHANSKNYCSACKIFSGGLAKFTQVQSLQCSHIGGYLSLLKIN